jgi:predicted DNA-binding transcriptional regulator YafY
MRIDRMLGIIVLLLNRDKISAKKLSERFAVSVRTIYRDIEAINMAGIPIVSHAGSNGGFGIMENYRLDRQILSIDDMTSIITALKGVGTSLGDNDLDNIAEKILSLVPREKIENVNKHFEEVVIDIAAWGFREKSKEYLKILQSAISENHIVKFLYRNMRGEILQRTVEPMTVIFKGYAWYLFAFCKERNDYRLFRLSRMDNLEIVNQKFQRKNISYKEYFSNPENLINTVDLVLKFSPEVKIRVEEYFEESVVKYTSDGSMIVSVSFPEDEWIYSTVLSFGEFVEVVSPQRIREIVHEKAKKICAVYKADTLLSQS